MINKIRVINKINQNLSRSSCDLKIRSPLYFLSWLFSLSNDNHKKERRKEENAFLEQSLNFDRNYCFKGRETNLQMLSSNEDHFDNHARTYVSRPTMHFQEASKNLIKKKRGGKRRISIKPGLIKLSGEEEITGRIISIQMTSRRSWLKRCLLLLEREKVEGERGEEVLEFWRWMAGRWATMNLVKRGRRRHGPVRTCPVQGRASRKDNYVFRSDRRISARLGHDTRIEVGWGRLGVSASCTMHRP